MHLLLLLESPFSLQDWVFKLGPSVYMATKIKKKKKETNSKDFRLHTILLHLTQPPSRQRSDLKILARKAAMAMMII